MYCSVACVQSVEPLCTDLCLVFILACVHSVKSYVPICGSCLDCRTLCSRTCGLCSQGQRRQHPPAPRRSPGLEPVHEGAASHPQQPARRQEHARGKAVT